jgi:general L-amino acid transport system permease protein
LRRDRGTDITQQFDPRPQNIGDGAQRFRGLDPDGAVIGIIGPGQQRKAVGMGLPVEIAAIDNGAADRGPMRLLSVAFIEVMRAIPMVAILYFAMLILPMALPAGVILDKLTRATIMIALFWTAYLAEVVRGGLQTIGAGQSEAAQSLGLGYWQAVRLVVLPQALRRVIPGLVNLGIGFLLATSLLAVIGAFDLLNTAKASTTDQQWLGFYDEAYIFAAAIYFLLCFAGSRYSLWLEERLRRG